MSTSTPAATPARRVRPCRSALYVPASNARALAKAATLAADAIIVDLEDSVAPEAKPAARDAAIAALVEGRFGERTVALRVNGVDTPWHAADLEAVRAAAPAVVVLPKTESRETLAELAAALEADAATRETRIWAMLETPLAVVRAAEIAAFAGEPDTGGAVVDETDRHRRVRLEALLVGNNDLARAAGMPIEGSRPYLMPWLMGFVAAAKAHGLAILDGVYNDFADGEGFARECREGVCIGMDGKTLIHPSQIEPTHRLWTPDAATLAEARAIVAAFDDPAAAGRGAIALGGRMVERLHLDIARRTLARAGADESS